MTVVDIQVDNTNALTSYTCAEAAEILGCSVPYVRRCIKRGEIKSWKLRPGIEKLQNPTYRIPQSALADFIQGRSV